VQGLPGGRYVTAARSARDPTPETSTTRRSRAEAACCPYEVRRCGRRAPSSSSWRSATDGSRELRVLVPGARRVELMGDFTDWTPVALTPLGRRAGGRGSDGDDVWLAELVIAPGVHRVNVRVDGGPWRPPPGLSVVRDEFGGEVGLLVVR
jgi:hypothetical protein